VEIIPSAIADAGKNADINGITNCKFVVGKAEEKLYEIINTHSKHGKIVAIVDPPRAGLRKFIFKFLSLIFSLKITFVCFLQTKKHARVFEVQIKLNGLSTWLVTLLWL